MPLSGHSTCPHCAALLAGPVCTICGKSITDAVDVAEPAPKKPGLSEESRRQLMGFGAFLATVAILGAAVTYLVTRSSEEPAPTALAIPETTTTIERAQPAPVELARPGRDAEPLPTLPATDAVERDVGAGVNPWRGAPPRNVLTGELLENTDFSPGIAAVAELVASSPSGFTIGSPTELEWNGVDLAAAETAQPFAARGISDETGPVADLWFVARGPSTSDGSAAFLAAALEQWSADEPIDSFSPRPGIRIHQIAVDDETALWVDIRDSWMVLYRTTTEADPALLGSISETWG